MLRIFIAVVFGAAMGSLATLTFFEPSSRGELLASPVFQVASESPIQNNEVARLHDENIQLKQQLHLRDTNVIAEKDHVKELVATNDNSKVCEEKIKDLIDFYAQKDIFLAELKDMGNAPEYDARLHADFDREEFNQDWSSATEKSISMQLEKNDAARNIIPSSIRCRSSSCELKIPVANVEARNKAMEILASPDFAHNLGFKRFTTKAAMEIVAGEMTLYIKNK